MYSDVLDIKRLSFLWMYFLVVCGDDSELLYMWIILLS